MKTNQAALDLIKEFEGFVGHWYPDPATGAEPYTCCYGHTDAAGLPRYKDDKTRKFTEEQGEAILKADLIAVENTVLKAVKVPLTPNQFGALVSFTYNVGGGNLRKSTLLKKVNLGDFAGAGNEFAKWNKAAGKVMAGLTRRRQAEALLFRRADTAAPPPPDIEPIDDTPVQHPMRLQLTPVSWLIIGALALAGVFILVRMLT